MKISVVVPTLGRESLKVTVAALKKQSKKAHEILVIYDKQRKGACWPRNQGYEKATGDIIAYIDDDCEPPRDWLKSIEAIFKEHKADVVGGTYEEKDPLFADIRRIRKRVPTKVVEDKYENVAIGGNIAFTKKILTKLKKTYGYIYDERIITGEDYEIIWRLKTMGAKLYFNPVTVTHHRRVKKMRYIRLQFYRGIGIASLDRIRKQYPNITTHKSILWEKKGTLKKAYLLVTKKLLGPFNARKFSTFGNYLAYWAGAKTEALGYLYGKIFRKAGWKSYAKNEVRTKK